MQTMKCFIITLFDNPESVKLAETAYESALSFGYSPNLFCAHTGSTGARFLEERNIAKSEKFPMWTTTKGVLGCFASHLALWETCVSLKEPIIVLEHDAKMVRRWDNFYWKDVLHLDYEGSVKRKHYAQGKDRSSPVVEHAVYNMGYIAFDQPWTASMNCAYAYAIQPDAAKRLIEFAAIDGWYAADRFIQEPVVNIDTIHWKVAEEQPEALTISTTSM